MNKLFFAIDWEDTLQKCAGCGAVNVGVQVKLACASAIRPAKRLFLKMRNVKTETNGPVTGLVESP